MFPFVLLNLALASSTGYDEEIVVSADFRNAPISRLAASLTVLRPDERGDTVNHLEELLGQIPNLNFSSGASRGRYFQIRGIGERGQFSEPLNSSVGLIVDGVDMSGIGGAATLFDIEQIEVLRGPQGTLYGANALAGLINMTTPAPSTDHTTKFRIDAGDYGAFGVGGVVSGPLAEAAGYRVSVQRNRDDGFMDNDFLGRDNTANHDELTARAKIVWQSGRRDGSLNLAKIDIENGYDGFSLDNNRNTLSDQPGRDEQFTDYAALKVGQSFATVRFELSTSIARTDVTYGYDEDWTFDGFDPIGYASFDLYERERETQTLEVRWLSAPNHGLLGNWDWVAGIYALRQDVEFSRRYTFSGPFNSDFQTQRVALYAEIARDVGRDWRITLGGRFERYGSEYDDANGVEFDPQDDLFGGRLLFERALGDASLLYFGLTQGYKTGGFNQDGSLPAELREYDEETLWNMELGYKARLLDERLHVRAALFRMQRQDIQLQTSISVAVPGNPVGDFVVFRSNAAKGFNQGVELETEWYASQWVTLFANVAWLDSEYDRFVNASGAVVSGRQQAHAPEYQFFVGVQFDFSERWSARVEMAGKDSFYYSDSHDQKSDSYELVNASVGYQADGYRVRLWGRNLTDEEYPVRGFFFGNDPRDLYTARTFTQLGEPSRVGLSVEFEL